MTKLTQREKLLLYVLCLVLALAAGWFLIKPASEASMALDDALSEAQMQKAGVEQVIASRPIYAESMAESLARVETLREAFLPAMTNDDLDRYITGLLQKNGLVAESLLISASEDEAVSLAVTKLSVRVAASGELDRFVALVQQVSELKGIRIAGLVVQEQGEKTVTVPLSAEELAALAASAAGKKPAAAQTETPGKEITVTTYRMELNFEVAEFDRAMFAAMAG